MTDSMRHLARMVATQFHLMKLTEEINLCPEDITEVFTNTGKALTGLMQTLAEEQGVSDEECLMEVQRCVNEFADLVEASQETLQ